MKPTQNKVPRHIGLIVDGNRRFAKKLMLKPWKGHEWGAKKFEKLLNWCEEIGVKEVTLYVFSLENFNRPKEEFDYLMDLFVREFNKLLTDKKVDKKQMKINFIGRTYMLPEKVQEVIKKVSEKTKDYNSFILNFAIAYSGRAEVIDATKKIAEKIKEGKLNIDEINEDVFKRNMYIESDPDLIIRTSGEFRTSGFLLYQGAYSELFFCDKMWPEFEKEDLLEAIESYKKRHRRFGR